MKVLQSIDTTNVYSGVVLRTTLVPIVVVCPGALSHGAVLVWCHCGIYLMFLLYLLHQCYCPLVHKVVWHHCVFT